MSLDETLDKMKEIILDWDGFQNSMESALEEMVKRYYIVEKQKEDAEKGNYITPEGYVLVYKYELDRLIDMAWGHCKGCVVPDCSRKKRECIIIHTSNALWKSYCKAFGLKDEADKQGD